MNFIKNLPNLLTLFNLFLGCMAIVYLFNDHMVIIDAGKNMLIDMGNVVLASYCIFLAAIIDFCDGFIARILHAESALGRQLDTLADMVTFGLVPGIIMYQLMARSYYASYDAFDYPVLYYAAGFAITIFAALRLAKFNIDDRQQYEFKGLPVPSVALIIAALPVIILRDEWNMANILSNKWWLILILILLCYFMVCDIAMPALKFRSLRFNDNKWQLIIILAAIIIFLAGLFIFDILFLIIPLIIILYILISITKNIAEHGI